MRKIILNFGLVFSGVLVGVIASEAILMLLDGYVVSQKHIEILDNEFRFYQYDEILGWRGVPGASGDLRFTEGKSLVKLNAQGFRDKKRSIRKQRATYRIVAFGDSFTWGYGVEQNEIWMNALERCLENNGIQAEVINLGMTGYGTDQEYLLYTYEGFEYEPDIVIVAFNNGNDLMDNLFPSRYGYPKPYFDIKRDGSISPLNIPVPRKKDWMTRWDQEREDHQRQHRHIRSSDRPYLKNKRFLKVKFWLEEHSRLYLRIRDLLKKNGKIKDILLQLYIIEYPEMYHPEREKQSSQNEKGWELTYKLLSSFDEKVKGNGSRFLLLLIPNFSVEKSVKVQMRSNPYDDLKRWARSQGIACLDLWPGFSQMVMQEGVEAFFYNYNGAHWKAKGHQLAGELICNHLLDHHSLPISK